jgi:hypothetical protein
MKWALVKEVVERFTPLLQLPDSYHLVPIKGIIGEINVQLPDPYLPKYREKPPPGNVTKWRTKRLDKGKLFDKAMIKHAANVQKRKRSQMYRMTGVGLEWYRKHLGAPGSYHF